MCHSDVDPRVDPSISTNPNIAIDDDAAIVGQGQSRPEGMAWDGESQLHPKLPKAPELDEANCSKGTATPIQVLDVPEKPQKSDDRVSIPVVPMPLLERVGSQIRLQVELMLAT